jgi:DUF1680 family protein
VAAEVNAPVPVSQFTGRGPAQQTAPVRLLHKDTGEVIERLPVDAREILAAPNCPYEREDVALARGAALAAASDEDGDETPDVAPLPAVKALAGAIASLDAEAVAALQARDERASAAPIYAARLAALAAASDEDAA